VDQQLVGLTQEFNKVLWNDLDGAGIFEMVSKSYYPLKVPVEPQDVDFKAWVTRPLPPRCWFSAAPRASIPTW